MTTPAPARHAAAAAGEDADLALLTGPESVEIVRAALAGSGSDPVDLSVTVAAVHHRPGAGVSVCYDASHAAAPAGEVLVASTTPPTRHDTTDSVAVLADGLRTLRVWRRAHDPALPGLRAALDPPTVAGWLGTASAPDLTLLSYRPTRRAVVVARAGAEITYLKVVAPRKAADLVARHRVLAGTALPAPALLGEPTPGVALLARADGVSLAQALASGDPAQIPSPESVLAALDSLPTAVLDLPQRPSWVDRLGFHAAAARSALPARAGEIDDVVRRVQNLLAACPVAREVPTHGDLNVANLFVRDGAPTAVIDVDSLGPGRRVDDLATVLAHLQVLPSLAPASYGAVPAVIEAWRVAFDAAAGPVELQARTAAVLVSLVAGASPEQAETRLDLARTAVGQAEKGSTR